MRSFFIITLMSFNTFVFAVNSTDEVITRPPRYSHVCPDYILDVSSAHPYQTYPIDIHIQDEVRDRIETNGILGGLGGRTLRLELRFNIINSYNSPPLFTAIGRQSVRIETNNFDRRSDFSDNFGHAHLRYALENHIINLVRETVRNGYQALNESFGDHYRPIRSTVTKLFEDNSKIMIPLGRSNYIQEGDIFHIFPSINKEDNNDNLHCPNIGGPSLARASVIQIDNHNAILKVTKAHNRRREVQVGDIIEAFSENNIESRYRSNQQEMQDSKRKLLRLGFIPPFIITSQNNFYEKDITSLIREYLLKEARRFNLQIVE